MILEAVFQGLSASLSLLALSQWPVFSTDSSSQQADIWWSPVNAWNFRDPSEISNIY